MSESVFATAATAARADRNPHLTVTRLRLRWSRPDALAPFFRLSLENARAAECAEGFLGGALWVDARLSFWTLTLWNDAASMNAYAYGPTHLRAIEHLRRYRSAYCEAAFAGGPSPTAGLPDQDAAFAFLTGRATFFELPRASSDHRAGRVRAPRIRNVRQLEPKTV
jgi:hypothetical protein